MRGAQHSLCHTSRPIDLNPEAPFRLRTVPLDVFTTPLPSRVRDLLIGAAIPLLLPFGVALELGVLLLAGCGLRWLLRRQATPAAPAERRLLAVFAMLWAAAALSTLDAAGGARGWIWLLAAPGYALASLALLHAASDPQRRPPLLLGAALPVALWTLDGLLQVASGWSLGGPATADRWSGVFGADDLKLGPVLALLAPFLLLPCLDRDASTTRRRWSFLLVFVALTALIGLAGARAAWIGYALALCALALHRLGQQPVKLAAGLAAALLISGLLAIVGYTQSTRFAERVDRTLIAFDGTSAGLDHALAGRLPIFQTAVQMSLAHPINGVGVREFRYAYPQYAAEDDPWVADDGSHGAAHPHHWVLEVAAEQGLAGLLAWTAVLLLLLRSWWQASPTARATALAPALALLVLLWPLNTHPALYSSFWQALWWWCLGLYLGCLVEPRAASR